MLRYLRSELGLKMCMSKYVFYIYASNMLTFSSSIANLNLERVTYYAKNNDKYIFATIWSGKMVESIRHNFILN